VASETVYGLVLAGGESRRMGRDNGGESRRMGRDKALLVRDGQSQLAHITALLEGITDRVYVSSRQEQQNDPERSRFENITDRYEGIGPIAGILS